MSDDMRPVILADKVDLRRSKGLDPFADPDIAAEMKAVVGVRYVCATLGCDWWGYQFDPEVLCPECSMMPIDRWAEHARAIEMQDQKGWIG